MLTVYLLACLKYSLSTIDINEQELRYLANHLSHEECRRLVAAAHFKQYEQPKVLGEAELKVAKDIPCFDLLLHWNSSPGEGKGESHEVLEHRLRQMGKIELADWLGKTVFHQIGKDLEDSVEAGLKDLAAETTVKWSEKSGFIPTAAPFDPLQWTTVDAVLYGLVLFLLVSIIGVCCMGVYQRFCKGKKKSLKQTYEHEYKKIQIYEESSDSEDSKFDIRNINEESSESSAPTTSSPRHPYFYD